LLQIPCPSCRRSLNLPEAILGQEVRCPVCQSTFQATEQSAPPPAPPEPAPPPSRRYDDPIPPRAPARRRSYDDYGDPEFENPVPLNTGARNSAFVWMLIAAIVDLLVLPLFYIFLYTVEPIPPRPEGIFMFTVMALLFYVTPLVFVFVGAGVLRNPQANGLIITGSVMAFILAFELLLLSGLIAVAILESLSGPFSRGRLPGVGPVLFIVGLAGLVLSIVGGVKALVAITSTPPRHRGDFY
jgi:LSD1 subclass zinc finger protein